IAVKQNSLDMVKFLLKQPGLDVILENSSGKNALQLAQSSNFMEIAQTINSYIASNPEVLARTIYPQITKAIDDKNFEKFNSLLKEISKNPKLKLSDVLELNDTRSAENLSLLQRVYKLWKGLEDKDSNGEKNIIRIFNSLIKEGVNIAELSASELIGKNKFETSTLLHSAVRVESEELVKALLSQKLEDNEESLLNVKANEGNTPLMIAIKSNSTNMVKLLLQQPEIDLVARDSSSKTASESAIASNFKAITRVISDHIAKNPAVLFKMKYSELTKAIDDKDVDKVEKILKEIEANPQLKSAKILAMKDNNSGSSLSLLKRAYLSWKAIDDKDDGNGDKKTAKIINALLKAGVDLHEFPVNELKIKNGFGKTLLHSAARSGSIELAKALLDQAKLKELLLNSMANNGSNGGTPLMAAAYWGDEEMVNLLLAQTGIDVTLRDKDSFTAIEEARNQKHEKVAQIIEDYVAKESSAKRPDAYIKLKYYDLAKAVDAKDLAKVDSVLEDISSKAPEVREKVLAMKDETNSSISLLLQKALKNWKVATSFQTSEVPTKIINSLVKAGTKLEQQLDINDLTSLSFSQNSLLHLAAYHKSEELLKALLASTVSSTVVKDKLINSANEEGSTPIMVAVYTSNANINNINSLLAQPKIDINLKNKSSAGVVDYAKAGKNENVIDIINKFIADQKIKVAFNLVEEVLTNSKGITENAIAQVVSTLDGLSEIQREQLFKLEEEGSKETIWQKAFKRWQASADNDSDRMSTKMITTLLSKAQGKVETYVADKDLKLRNNYKSSTILHSALRNNSENEVLANQLFSSKGDLKNLLINAQTQDYHTVLTLAASAGNKDLVKRLLDTEAVDLTVRGGSSPSLTPMDWARKNDHMDIVTMINDYMLHKDLVQYNDKIIDIEKIMKDHMSKSKDVVADINLLDFAKDAIDSSKKLRDRSSNADSKPLDLATITKKRRKFRKEHPGFAEAHGSFLSVVEKGLTGPVQYSEGTAPLKMGISGSASIGKSTYLDHIIKESGLNRDTNVHFFTLDDKMATAPYSEIAKYGISKGDHSLPHLFVFDEFFKLKDFKDLTPSQRAERVQAIKDMNSILGNGTKSIPYTTKPEDAVKNLATIIQSIRETQSKIKALEAKAASLASSGKDKEEIQRLQAQIDRDKISAKQKEDESRELATVSIQAIKKDYAELFGALKTKSENFIIDTIINYPTELITFLVHKAHALSESNEKIFPHVVLMYAGILPTYKIINEEFQKLPAEQQTLGKYRSMVLQKLPNPVAQEKELVKWLRTSFYPPYEDPKTGEKYPGIATDDIQRLGLNRTFINISPFSSETWKAIVTQDTNRRLEKKLRKMGISEEEIEKVDMDFDEEAVNLVVTDILSQYVGRRNIEAIIDRYYGEMINNIALKIQASLQQPGKLATTSKKEKINDITLKYDRKLKKLHAYAADKRSPLLSEDLSNSIKGKNAEITQPSPLRLTLEKLVFYDVGIREMQALPSKIPNDNIYTLSNFMSLWTQEDSDFTNNLRGYLNAIIAKKYAMKNFNPSITIDIPYDSDADAEILATIQALKQRQLESMPEGCPGGNISDQTDQPDKVLRMIAETPEEELMSGSAKYEGILNELKKHAKMLTIQNKNFIVALQEKIEKKEKQFKECLKKARLRQELTSKEEEILKTFRGDDDNFTVDINWLKKFYSKNLPKKADKSLSKIVKEDFGVKSSLESTQLSCYDDNCAENWKTARKNIVEGESGQSNSGLRGSIKNIKENNRSIFSKILASLKLI
ncbi:MAG: ankyrin repeat domain-containing protein, partial [Oligoflexia bacterium]|nr:ankyrin repeat domain-containing protein [Oligoflexia bacterium]